MRDVRDHLELKKFNKSRLVKVVLLSLLMTTGISMISFAFVVDWIGLSLPGFSRNQVVIANVGVVIVLLGGALWLLRKRITDELVGNMISKVPPKRDIIIAVALFCVGIIVGTVYVSAVHVGSFYAYTLHVHPPLIGDLVIFHGIFLGGVLALAYGIFRLGMGRLLSILFTLFFMSSPINLYNLVPSLWRDYAKVPFILGFVFLMLFLVIRPFKRYRLYISSAIVAIVLGIGMGVRHDLIAFVIPFVVSVFFFLPGPLFGNIKTKVVALSLFALLLIIQLPFFLPSTRSSGASAFITLCGLMTPLDARLGVTRPTYDYGYLFLDQFVFAVSHGQKAVNPDYDPSSFSGRAFSDYLLKIGMNFPSDVLTRTYASMLEVLETPFTYIETPTGIVNDFITALYYWRAKILRILAGSGFIICVAALLMISTHSLRKAFFGLLFLIFLAGSPTLHFFGRHYFHLQLITWWCLGFVIQHTLQFAGRFVHSSTRNEIMGLVAHPGRWWNISARRILMFIVGSLMILLIPLLVLRQYQSQHVGNLLQEYAEVDLEPLHMVKQPIDKNIVLMTVPGLFKNMSQRLFKNMSQSKEGVVAEFLVAEFSNVDCTYSTVWTSLRYLNRDPFHQKFDFSRFMGIKLVNPGKSRSTRLFFPAFNYWQNGKHTRFSGIEMTHEQAPCLKGLYRVKNPSQFSILLTATVPPTGKLYQTLAVLESGNIYTVPVDMDVTIVEELLERPLSSLTTNDVAFQADIVHLDTDRWVVSGYATPQRDPCNNPLSDRTHSTLASASFSFGEVCKVDTDLLISKDTWLGRGSCFVAQGELYAGGMSFGLIKDGRTVGYVHVTARGPFTIVIEVPEDGLYSIGLANNLNMYTSLENRFVVTKVGWAKAIYD